MPLSEWLDVFDSHSYMDSVELEVQELLLYLTTETAPLFPAPNFGYVSRRVLRLLVGP